MRLLISRSQVRISHVAECLLLRGSFLIFLISLYRAAFCHVLASIFKVKLRFCANCFFLQNNGRRREGQIVGFLTAF